MKFNFKKISAVFAGALMAGMAMGGAVSAANYPSPFQDNVANTAVVYGSDALSSDESVANSIQADLAEFADDSGSSSVTLGEDSAFISGTGDDLTFKEDFSQVTDSLDDGDLPNLLAEGTLEDESVDYNEETEVNYFQDLELSGDYVTFDSLDDDDYVVNTDAAGDELPVLHVDQGTDEAYTLVVDFATAINASAKDDSEAITIAGKELTFDQEMSSGDEELVLFESSETFTLEQGESKTVNGDTVELTGGTSDTANLKINDQIESVGEGDSESGFYVNKLITDDYSSETGSITVELFAGAEEWVLDTAGSFEDVEIENEDVEGVQAKVVTKGDSGIVDEIEEISFEVTPSDMDEDEKSYLEMGESLEDPLFGFNMVFDGMEPELKSEDKGMIGLSSGESVSLEFTSRNGKEYSISPFEISSDSSNVTAGENWYADGSTYTGLAEDDIFIAHEGSTDSEESLVYQVATVEDDDGESPYVEFEDLSDGSTVKTYAGDEIKDTGLYVSSMNDGDTTFDLEDDQGLASVNNQLVTENHMRMTLNNNVTIDAATSASEGDTVTINGVVYEYDDDGTFSGDADFYFGDTTNGGNYSDLSSALEDNGFVDSDGSADNDVTLGGYQVDTFSTTGDVTASNEADIVMKEDEDGVFSLDDDGMRGTITVDVGVDSSDEELTIKTDESDHFKAVSVSDTDTEYAVSEIGTYYESDTDEYTSIDVWTPSEGQTTYDVAFSGEVTEEEDDSSEETGAMLVTDSEMDDVDDMNLIVVGGSCVNTAAADLLGVEYQTCGEDFTEATGVGSGEALIKGYSDSDLTSEHAVLVAGYSADDTNNAAKYLMNEDVDTSEEYTVSSATEATMTSSE